MRKSGTGWGGVAVSLLSMLVGASALRAQEVYKWVDEAGRTHYGQRKPDAPSARASAVKIHRTPEAAPVPSPRPEQRAQSTAAPAPVPARSAKKSPEALSDGRDHGTDASRCALARDVLSGAVRHRNGAPTDQLDIETAKSDIRLFCKSR